MITKAQVKEIKSLQLKKNRVQHQRFLVEGAKSVLELIDSKLEIISLLYTSEFISNHSTASQLSPFEQFEVPVSTLEKLGSFKSNDQALAVVKSLPNTPIEAKKDEYVLILDDVRDPGNLGTIIRIADWYGIDKIVVSETTAELYNPKVISATKGSFTRVNVYYTDLIEYLNNYSGSVYGAFMDGQTIHSIDFAKGGLIVMGNESNGVSDQLSKYITNKITIPRYGNAESLNVAIATAVICDNMCRSLNEK